ncbi:unnamed protein product [Adineta steineri]|uniref:Amine oxidase domain-containing protein n=1 Tax=Adineta steineri TaxID=433720 RepID=A0A813RPC6_9BILA|nr:unnamed protein product [Adineta steineri]CAF4147302.1 unnamed protein product [Adineta steineri]
MWPSSNQTSEWFGGFLDTNYYQMINLTQRFNQNPYGQPFNGHLLIYISSDQRYGINGGNYLLPTRITKYLQDNNIIIQMNYNLTKITVTTDHKISLSFANGETILFDHVILTLPLSTLRYDTNTKLNLQFLKRFRLEKSSNDYIYTDLPFLNSWELSTGFDSISNYEINSSTNSYIRQFLNDLNEIWPNASSYYTGEGTISAPWIDPYFLGSYPSRTRDYEKQRQMNIYFAGDYTSLNYFACMEGTIREGRRAALEVFADYQ